MIRALAIFLAALAAIVAPIPSVPAQYAASAAQQQLHIGFVEVKGDPRYEPIRTYANVALKSPAHPDTGAEIGLAEAAALSAFINTDFVLDRMVVNSAADVPAAINRANDSGTRYFLLDIPAAVYPSVASAVRGRDLLLFNVSEPADALRRQLCAPEFVHVYPSRAQLTDALAQYVVSRKWRNVLVLQGGSPDDAAMARSFDHSAQKFGAVVVAQKQFKPGTDPRDREQNDPMLLSDLTKDYDIAFVADDAFDFARTVPYHLARPRPVMGSIDLRAAAWQWVWDRNGAPQVNRRFEKASGGRHMSGRDWAAWLAVKMIVQSVLRIRSGDFAKQRAFILSDAGFDADKGLAVSVRPWDHQVRQAILLVAPYEVVASAPIEGFLHQNNVLDTLGDDQPESPCHMDK